MSITEEQRMQLVNELNIKIKELQHRMFFKVANHNKAVKLYQVNMLLSKQAEPFLIEGAIKDARIKTEVFNYGMIGKFFAGICLRSTKPKTKSDILLDKILNKLTK
jgi:hypothetical protein